MERLTNSRLEKCCDYFVSFGSKESKREYRELAEDAPKYEQLYKRLAEYEKIGTVEEFKALKEIDEDVRLKYCYEDLSNADNSGYMRGYTKAISDFYDKALNFEDYIEPEATNGSRSLYAGVDITDTVVKIKDELSN